MKTLTRKQILKIFDRQIKYNQFNKQLKYLNIVNKKLYIETENLTIDDFRKIRTSEFWYYYNQINNINFETESIFQIERLQKEFLYKKVIEYKLKERIEILYKN